LRLLEGTCTEVAERLQALVDLPAVVTIGPDDEWVPRGVPVQRNNGQWDLSPTDEALLDEHPTLLPPEQRRRLEDWWFTVPGGMSPNWDIVCKASIANKKGFLLIEAKAHAEELTLEERGKVLRPPVSTGTRRNHARIGWCVEDASLALAGATGLPWALSRDHHYQMSNRFAWSWKLTELGYPVVLVYLGFLQAAEMNGPFETALQWENAVKAHSNPLFPNTIWGEALRVNRDILRPLIRSVPQPLNRAAGGDA
jgi:hypothetical protein